MERPKSIGKAKDLADSAADWAQEMSKKALDTAMAQTQVALTKGKEATSTTTQKAQEASTRTLSTTAGQALAASRRGAGTAASAIAMLSESAQGLLASSLSSDLNGLIQNMVEGSATIYDKAMDAEYIATHVGGAYHRLFDGGHTIAGAFNAARGAAPDDNIIQEAMGTVQGLLRDGSTPRGLPLANWDKATFDHVAGVLESDFHIPKSWFYDLNTYDAAELLGGTIGIVALTLNWKRADTESFARLVGSMGISAAISTNPLLLVITVVALAKAFHRAHETGEYAEFVDGALKGGVGAGATLTAVSLVGVAGGPAGAAVLVGLTTGVLVHVATKNVSVVQISQFVAEQLPAATAEAQEAAFNSSISSPPLAR